MRTYIIGAILALASVACEKQPSTSNLTPHVAAATGDAPAPGKHLFLDVHELGPGKVSLEAAAGAHQKDLATQDKYGANFRAYWVDQAAGKIFCLVEAPSADAALATHKEAHGLMPSVIEEVSPGR